MSYLPTIKNKISTANARAASTLAAGAVYQGTGEDVSKYGRVGVSIVSDNATDGVLTMEVSRDNVTWGGPTRNFADTRFSEPHMWNIVEKYFRIKYTNGTTEATNLAIQVQYSVNADTLLGHQLDATLLDETEAIIARSVGVGLDPLGSYGNFKASGTAFVTATNVAAGVTFSSDVLDARGYSQIQTEIDSDKDGTIVASFYSDSAGSNLVRQLTIPYVAADGYQFFGAPAFVDYIKYQFTNTEASDTTSFYFTTKFKTEAISPQLLRTDGYVNPQMIASLTRSVNHFDLDAAREHIVGQRSFFFFGFNNAVGTTWVDIHPNSGNINWLTTAGKVGISSSSAADNGTTPGLGVQSVEIHGLSATGVDQKEIILTNGTAEVDSLLDYIRVNKLHSETCGTYGGSHQGDITARVASGGAKSGAILSKMIGEEGSVDTAVVYGLGEAANGYWTVPLGKVMYITRLEVIPDVATNKNVTVHLYERENILDVLYGKKMVLKAQLKESLNHILKSKL
jgi:hypothetical protein